MIEEFVKTYEELAFKLGDQSDFFWEKFLKYKDEYQGHFMVEMNKKLVGENRDLKKKLEMA